MPLGFPSGGVLTAEGSAGERLGEVVLKEELSSRRYRGGDGWFAE
jgi:hypothetical protein